MLAQAALSVALGVAITVPSSRLAVGRWPDPDDIARLRVDEATFPVLRLALAATVVLAVVPHLVRPLQRVARWILLLGLLAGVLVEAAAPSGHPRCAPRRDGCPRRVRHVGRSPGGGRRHCGAP